MAAKQLPTQGSLATIPVTIIGGYLGAGKTTLVNQLLRQAQGERIAVLVNDFGDINIDADLIEARDDNLISLAGGCVCCSFGSDLLDALTQVAALQPRPQRVLIETSGVALPRPVARSLALIRGFHTDALVVVADARALRERAADRYVGETVLGQLRDADLLLIGKTDLVDAADTARLRAWLAEVAPQAVSIQMEHGQVGRALLFGDLSGRAIRAQAPRPESSSGKLRRPISAPHAGATPFASVSLEFSRPVELATLARTLTDPALGIARAKGVVLAPDRSRWLLQQVGRRLQTEPADQGGIDDPGRLVVIGARAEFDQSGLLSQLFALGARRLER
ncbi:MAG: GTP-binding protein [Quisquiliibacterium sp.]